MIRLKLAWHVLRGRPLIYGYSLVLAAPIHVPRHGAVVGTHSDLTHMRDLRSAA